MKTEFFSLDLKECVSPPYSYFSNLIFKKNVLKGLVLCPEWKLVRSENSRKKSAKMLRKKKRDIKLKARRKSRKGKSGTKFA